MCNVWLRKEGNTVFHHTESCDFICRATSTQSIVFKCPKLPNLEKWHYPMPFLPGKILKIPCFSLARNIVKPIFLIILDFFCSNVQNQEAQGDTKNEKKKLPRILQISGQTKTVIVFQLKCFKTVHDNKEGLWLSLVCIFIWTVLAQSFLDLVSIKVCFSNTIFLAKNFHMFTIKKRDFLQYEAACLSSSYPLSYALRAWSLWTNETLKSTNKTWQHLTLSKHAGKWNNALQWATLYRCNPNECRMALGSTVPSETKPAPSLRFIPGPPLPPGCLQALLTAHLWCSCTANELSFSA